MPDDIYTRALNITKRGPNVYVATIGREQRFGEFAHGGFAASLIVHTALEHVKTTLKRQSEQHITSCHVQFLRPVNKTEVQLQVEEPKVGKAIATLHVKLLQKDVPVVTADITVIDASANRGVNIDVGLKLVPSPTPVDLSKLESDSDPRWIKYHLPYSNTGQGQPLAHWNLYMTIDGPAHPRIHDMWYRLYNNSSRITTVMLPLIADFYLRMAENYRPDSDFSYNACLWRAKRSVNGDIRQDDLDKAVSKTWSATQSLSLEILRQLPPEGVKWIFLRAEGKVIKEGKLIAELTMLDENMELVAVGQGVDLLIPAQRWVGEDRRTTGGAKMMKI